MGETHFAICFSFTCPSGKWVSKFRRRGGGLTEQPKYRWTTGDRDVAEHWAREFGAEWRVVPVDPMTGRVVRVRETPGGSS